LWPLVLGVWNQYLKVNNVLGFFVYIRGALDVRATK
jgi:malic enzyme